VGIGRSTDHPPSTESNPAPDRTERQMAARRRLLREVPAREAGNAEAQHVQHWPRIRREAADLAAPGVPSQDLIQSGSMAFQKACNKFDPSRGNSLWTYARTWVRGAMIEFVAQELGLSDRARQLYARAVRAQRHLYMTLKRDPTAPQIVDEILRSATAPDDVAFEAASDADTDEGELGEAGNQLLAHAADARQPAWYVANPTATLQVVAEILTAQHGRSVNYDEAEEDDGDNDGWVRSRTAVIAPPHSTERTAVNRARLAEFLDAADQNTTSMLKWSILFLLHEECEYPWKDENGDHLGSFTDRVGICRIGMLAQPDHTAAVRVWSTLAEELGASRWLPADWQRVCNLFGTPPPLPTESALKKFYERGLKRVQN